VILTISQRGLTRKYSTDLILAMIKTYAIRMVFDREGDRDQLSTA